jgi:hypothetical protein
MQCFILYFQGKLCIYPLSSCPRKHETFLRVSYVSVLLFKDTLYSIYQRKGSPCLKRKIASLLIMAELYSWWPMFFILLIATSRLSSSKEEILLLYITYDDLRTTQNHRVLYVLLLKHTSYNVLYCCFYRLVSCLLSDMIHSAPKKQHKVLFRR